MPNPKMQKRKKIIYELVRRQNEKLKKKNCKARQVLYIEWKVNAQRLGANLTLASLLSNPKKIKDGYEIKLKCHSFKEVNFC